MQHSHIGGLSRQSAAPTYPLHGLDCCGEKSRAQQFPHTHTTSVKCLVRLLLPDSYLVVPPVAVVALERTQDDLSKQGYLGGQHPRRTIAPAGHAHRPLYLIHAVEFAVPTPPAIHGFAYGWHLVGRAGRSGSSSSQGIVFGRAPHCHTKVKIGWTGKEEKEGIARTIWTVDCAVWSVVRVRGTSLQQQTNLQHSSTPASLEPAACGSAYSLGCILEPHAGHRKYLIF